MSTTFKLSYDGQNISVSGCKIFRPKDVEPQGDVLESSGSLGTLLSWHSMHSRYIISNTSSIKVQTDGYDEIPPGLVAIPTQKSTLFRLTAPDPKKANQIMIWTLSNNPNIYNTVDKILWNKVKSLPDLSMYESSYVGIDHFLTNGSSFFTSLSAQVNTNKNDISDLSNRIKMIEHFLGGANPPDKISPNKIKNYYLGLSGKVPIPPAWPDISNQSIWRQFI